MVGHVTLVDDFLRLTPNQKPLLSKLQSIMEKEALAPEHYDTTISLLAAIENYLHLLSSSLTLEPVCEKLTPAVLIRMAGIRFDEDAPSAADAVFDYMTLVRELEGERLFIFVGLRSWLTDEETQFFTQTALQHQFPFLLIDSSDYPRLANEMRITVDRDLCVF